MDMRLRSSAPSVDNQEELKEQLESVGERVHQIVTRKQVSDNMARPGDMSHQTKNTGANLDITPP